MFFKFYSVCGIIVSGDIMFIFDVSQVLPYLRVYGQLLLYVILIVGLIFFIINGILRDKANFMTKGILFILIGSLLAVLFGLVTIIDYATNKPGNLGLFGYLSFIIVIISFTLAFGLPNIIRGKKTYQRVSFRKQKPSINRDIIQHVYVVYKCGSKVILKKNKELFSGFNVEMNKNNLFKDELIEKLNATYNANPIYDEINEIGIVSVNGKKPNIYYCYLIEITDISLKLQEEEVVDQYDVITVEMNDTDRQMVLRILMREPFKLYL